MNNKIGKRLSSFLENKELWVWLLVYLAITGILFGIANLIIYLVGIVPWIGVFALIAAGLLWGMIRYYLHKNRQKHNL